MVRRSILLAALLTASACATAGAQAARDAAPVREEKLSSPFELKPRESIRIAGEGLLVRFERVTSDSRCPVDVTCVWAGDAAVAVVLEKPKAEPATHELHTMSRFGTEAEYQGYVVHLDAVMPRPRTGRPIAADDYRVTLTVRRK